MSAASRTPFAFELGPIEPGVWDAPSWGGRPEHLGLASCDMRPWRAELARRALDGAPLGMPAAVELRCDAGAAVGLLDLFDLFVQRPRLFPSIDSGGFLSDATAACLPSAIARAKQEGRFDFFVDARAESWGEMAAKDFDAFVARVCPDWASERRLPVLESPRPEWTWRRGAQCVQLELARAKDPEIGEAAGEPERLAARRECERLRARRSAQARRLAALCPPGSVWRALPAGADRFSWADLDRSMWGEFLAAREARALAAQGVGGPAPAAAPSAVRL